MDVQPSNPGKPWLACGGILALLLLTAAPTPTVPAAGGDQDPRRALLQKHLTEARARLRLTDDQIEEYGKIQQERRQAMRKRLRQRRR